MPTAPLSVRLARPDERRACLAVLRQAPQASNWLPDEDNSILVAHRADVIVGVAAWRRTAPDEIELLNLAVAPGARRRGVASALVQKLLQSQPGNVFLEVRESNQPARKLYKKLGFTESGRRERYYTGPVEAAIVLNLHSC